jgi:hypothetical protein
MNRPSVVTGAEGAVGFDDCEADPARASGVNPGGGVELRVVSRAAPTETPGAFRRERRDAVP